MAVHLLQVLAIRHGQSAWNALGRWQGQADPPLTDLGRRQAFHAAQHLGTVDAIVASDLQRARETAEIIAEELGVGPVSVEPAFRERHAGEWEGLTKAEIEERWPGYLADRRRPPGFEPDGAFAARALEGLDRVRRVHHEGSVLVVAHAGVIFRLESHLGTPWAPLPNLAGRWFGLDADGEVHLGERVVLVEPDEVTVPGQL